MVIAHYRAKGVRAWHIGNNVSLWCSYGREPMWYISLYLANMGEFVYQDVDRTSAERIIMEVNKPKTDKRCSCCGSTEDKCGCCFTQEEIENMSEQELIKYGLNE